VTTTLDLLSRGYFPEELPPPFYSQDYATKVIANMASLPPAFTNPGTAKTISHNLMRVGKLRRQLGIPNPVHFFCLCREFELNWVTIDQAIQQTQLSKSTPKIGPQSGRALITSSGHKDLLPLRASVRSRSKYILKTDITRFYPSVYTHSIAWALHTKPVAKANKRNRGLLGNLLDSWIRNGQDGQTIGIPIGPDTSLVIAELILTDVDRALISRNPRLNGFRYVDDYELGFTTLGAAEETLAMLQDCLRHYSLELGSEKTTIEELPKPLESDWVPVLRNFQFRTSPRGQHSDITHYFDLAFHYSIENQRDSVINYALTRFAYFLCDPSNWGVLQSLLFECLMVEPASIIKVFSVLWSFRAIGFNVDLTTLAEILNFQITYHSSLGHTSEVAWAIWALIVFQIQMTNEAAVNVSKMGDSVIALLCLDARQQGLVPGGLNTTLWESFMALDE